MASDSRGKRTEPRMTPVVELRGCSPAQGRPHTEGHTWHQGRDDWAVPVRQQLVVRGGRRFWTAYVEVGDSRIEVSSG